MNKYDIFLKWWLFFTLICVAGIFAYHIGLLKELIEKDGSYLCIVILSIFVGMSLVCGYTTWWFCRVLHKDGDLSPHQQQAFLRFEETGWFTSELLLSLGMVGTIIGFCMMLTGFNNLDVSNQQTVQDLLSELGKSMATALYTTLVGLVCGSLLKLQYFNLSLGLQKHENQS